MIAIDNGHILNETIASFVERRDFQPRIKWIPFISSVNNLSFDAMQKSNVTED